MKEVWTTLNEIKFIEGLGSWSDGRASSKVLRRRYIEAIKDRKVWDDGDCMQVDKIEVMAYLEGSARIVKGSGPKGKEYLKLREED